jgi:hypothetical protein
MLICLGRFVFSFENFLVDTYDNYILYIKLKISKSARTETSDCENEYDALLLATLSVQFSGRVRVYFVY